MSKTCQVCNEPREKGRMYITTNLASSTTRLDGIQLCKKHSDNLAKYVWDLIHEFLQGINIED